MVRAESSNAGEAVLMQLNLTFDKEAEFKNWLIQQPRREGSCECCGRFAKVYKRRINSTMARQLIALYNLGGTEKYIHTSDLVVRCGTGDFAKARFWGLIYQSEEIPVDGAKMNGKWRLTKLGVDFVEGKLLVPEFALILFDKKIGSDGKQVTIQDCLESKGFNYQELMG
jgi:hypothetical protein